MDVIRVQLSDNISCLQSGPSHGAATAAVLVNSYHISPKMHCLKRHSGLPAASCSHASYHRWRELLSDVASGCNSC